MIHISLPDEKTRRCSFYLAMEEYVARELDLDDAFFMWQIQPSVIFGRNQVIEAEVNLKYCREHGIQTFRRKSGGGCVYADMSNVMFSYITKESNVNFTFNRYVNMVVLVLRKLGVDARTSGRNDIMIGDRKVSGNAFYHLPDRSIVHGTMLYDTDMQNMVGSITPSDDKLVSKGVKSVRQHIALLKDHISISLNDFKQFVKENLCTDDLMLDEEAIRHIEAIEQTYLQDSFIYGSNPRYTVVRKRRIADVGGFELRLEVANNVLKDINLFGDFFIIGDIDGVIARLRGCQLAREALLEAIPTDMENVIRGLSREEMVRMILNE